MKIDYFRKGQPVDKKEPRRLIKLSTFAEVHDLTMQVHERSPGDFYAHFESCEVKDGCLLVGSYGDGPTPEDAIREYGKVISGKTIVIDAMKLRRRQLECPTDWLPEEP